LMPPTEHTAKYKIFDTPLKISHNFLAVNKFSNIRSEAFKVNNCATTILPDRLCECWVKKPCIASTIDNGDEEDLWNSGF
jgi:hypothetical protein